MAKKKSSLQTRRIRGTGFYTGDEFSFRPSEPGEPTQLNVLTCKGGKLFTTTSEKSPLLVAHLTCAANAADPYAVYQDELDKLGIKPQAPQKFSEKKRLVSEDGVEVFLDQKQEQLTYQCVMNLRQAQNWQSEVLRQMQVIMHTLAFDNKFNKVINKIKKGGK